MEKTHQSSQPILNHSSRALVQFMNSVDPSLEGIDEELRIAVQDRSSWQLSLGNLDINMSQSLSPRPGGFSLA